MEFFSVVTYINFKRQKEKEELDKIRKGNKR